MTARLSLSLSLLLFSFSAPFLVSVLIFLFLLSWALVQPLECLPDVKELLPQLCEQYVTLKVLLDDWVADNPQKDPIMDRSEQAWLFWQRVEKAGAGCASWWTAASRVALRLPSSCMAERFFSVAKGSTKKNQVRLQDDNQEIRHLLAFNHSTLALDPV